MATYLFNDVADRDTGHHKAAGTLAAGQIARGYADGTYDPAGLVLPIQMVAFTSRALVDQG